MMGRNRRIGRRGFTLIELLVVIAIIGILAAMLFPVFARARESARKTQCLANVKNIAMAMQIYLTDYDRFFPGEHSSEAADFKDAQLGGGSGNGSCPYGANPYLRVPVILDEYIKSREVWKCPSAAVSTGASWIVNPYMFNGNGSWITTLQNSTGLWGRDNSNCDTSGGGGVCCVGWPPGWGGAITDSIGQAKQAASDGQAFHMSIATSGDLVDRNSSSIDDTSWYVVVADGGLQAAFWSPVLIAWPGICRTECGPSPAVAGCCSADWANCSWTRDCGLDVSLKAKILTDQEIGKKYARHLGGSNLGFADGHAKWISAYQIIAESPQRGKTDNGHLRGVGCSVGIGGCG